MYDDLYDVIVIGAGAAGLTAATMLGRSMRNTLVISKPRRRNSPASSVSNVPYADGAAPVDIYRKMEEDAGQFGVTILWDEVTFVRAYENHVVVEGAANPGLRCRRLLLATGRVDVLPAWLPDGVWGRSAFDCPYCHTYERNGSTFVCVGNGDETLKMAALSRQFAKRMTVLVGDPAASRGRLARLLSRHDVEVLCDEVVRASADPAGGVILETTHGQTLSADTLLLGDVVRPYRKLAEDLDLELSAEGFPETSLYGMTSNPLVYSAGNVEGSSYFMWTGAASSGINAARAICEDLAFASELLEDWE
ncbi:NAD(P)/FAD-dependent oxidoreductase [Streptomyces sp. NPDC045470]|uniref:NAD(P)/FAD-dependent oxidoreductase n=1 Tax=Streptomyces sp. NPDC045470 TaxID=3155469 RepID=UPI0033C5E3ED